MPNLELLEKDFEVTDSPGLSTLDPRFQNIAACIPQARFEDAARMTAEVLEDGVLDVRLVGYFLLGVFIDRGAKALPGIFRSINRLLVENWEAMGPAKKKDKQTDKSFQWFFKTLIQRAKYHEEKEDEFYQQWLQDCSWDLLEEAVQELNKFRRLLPQQVEDPKCMTLFQTVLSWVEEFQRVVHQAEEEAKAEEEAEQEAAAEEEEVEAQQEESGQQAPQGAAAPAGQAVTFSGVAIQGSWPLHQLKQKLDAFEKLCQQDDLGKAAVVALDINNRLQNFDPKEYFPRMFSSYLRLLSKHIETLSEHWDMQESMAWQALTELYKVDLDSFLELELG